MIHHYRMLERSGILGSGCCCCHVRCRDLGWHLYLRLTLQPAHPKQRSQVQLITRNEQQGMMHRCLPTQACISHSRMLKRSHQKGTATEGVQQGHA